MDMTDELAAKLLDYIEKTPRLYNNLEYLFKYKFIGFDAFKGKTIGEEVHGTNGWVGLCTTVIFKDDIKMYYGESEEELVDRLSKHAINYLTCVAALDMFIGKFRDQVFNTQHSAKLIVSTHILWNNQLHFKVGETTHNMWILIESDNYKLVDKALDLSLDVGIQKYLRLDNAKWHIKVNELNKEKLEEMMIAAGW